MTHFIYFSYSVNIVNTFGEEELTTRIKNKLKLNIVQIVKIHIDKTIYKLKR